MPVIKVYSVTTNRKCIKLHERAPYSGEDSSVDNKKDSGKYCTQAANMYSAVSKIRVVTYSWKRKCNKLITIQLINSLSVKKQLTENAELRNMQ